MHYLQRADDEWNSTQDCENWIKRAITAFYVYIFGPVIFGRCVITKPKWNEKTKQKKIKKKTLWSTDKNTYLNKTWNAIWKVMSRSFSCVVKTFRDKCGRIERFAFSFFRFGKRDNSTQRPRLIRYFLKMGIRSWQSTKNK